MIRVLQLRFPGLAEWFHLLLFLKQFSDLDLDFLHELIFNDLKLAYLILRARNRLDRLVMAVNIDRQ